MTEIDKTYEKVDNETTKSYEKRREKLQKEENELKEKLKNEVAKIKKQLEIYLSKVNELIRTNEKIVKGIKSLEKEEKILIKTLSYVSKINKNQKEMRILFGEPIKNVKISFIEEESKIKYEEYYFNGIPMPKDIEFKIGSKSINVLWKIDDTNLLNIDKNEIKYHIEIRKEKEELNKIYETKENNYTINNLEINTNYEIKICSIYKDIISNWTEIHKIKTGKIDSLILNELEKGNEFKDKLIEWTGYKNMELLYKGTRDGSGSNIFHNKCDNKGPTICLCKNEKGNIFGGYSSISWTSDNKFHAANGSFLFTLTNIHGIAPTKFPNKQNDNCAVYHGSDRGPSFGNGHDLYISNDYLNNNKSHAYLGYSYPDVIGKGNSIFSGEPKNSNNLQSLKIRELQVFKLFN